MRNRLLVALSVALVITVAIGLRVLNDSVGEGGFFSSELFLSQVSPGANEALYFVSPSSGSHTVGSTFQVELRLAASSGITSAKAYLNFNSSLLSVTNISTTGGVFQTYWEVTSTSNQVRIQASQPAPGISGNNNLVATITFQTLAGGTATLTYDASSLALKPDNSNILNIADSTTGSYIIDSTPPSRSNGQPTGSLSAGTTSTSISLNTDEAATCKYSSTSGVSYASMPNTFSTTGGTSHSTTVSGLSDGQSFTYYVRCRDSLGNTNTNDFPISFSVDPTPDTTPPSRSNGQPTGSLNSGTTSTSISLNTDEAATCKYATSPGVSYGSMPNTFSSTGGTSHSATVSGLSNGQSYTYYVRCRDSANNANTGDFPISFSVGTPPDTDPPSRSNGQPTGSLPSGTTSTSISLSTNESATCKYSTSQNTSYASMSNTFSSTGGTSHSTQVSGLSDDNSYIYYVRCRDAAGNANTGDFPIQFSVDPTPDTTPPQRSDNQPSGTLMAGTTSTAIQLTTDETATCRYSTSQNTSYASMSNTFSSTGGTSHSTTVSGLSNGQSYSYYVRCQDGAGNANANDFPIEFSVDSAADTTPPQRSDNAPAGSLGAGTTSTSISLVTNEIATCKYSTSSGVAYASMPNTFSSTDDTAHSTSVSGLSNSNSYTYYVRCRDESGNANTDDFPIEFSVAAASSGGGGGGGGSSGGGGGGGSSASSVQGDCNADSKVNIFDLSILISNWQKTTGTCDQNGDSKINIFDLSIMLSNWSN